MTINALSVWKSSFKAEVVPTDGVTWPDNMTNWYTAQFNSPKLSLPGITIAAPPLPATYGSAAFKAIYSTLAPGLSQSAAITLIADAWAAGLAASVVLVKPGDAIGVPAPATIWSVVTTSVFTPASVVAGKAKILELIGAPNVGEALDSQTPLKFYEATLLLKVTTTGLNSIPPPVGPLPLVDAERAIA